MVFLDQKSVADKPFDRWTCFFDGLQMSQILQCAWLIEELQEPEGRLIHLQARSQHVVSDGPGSTITLFNMQAAGANVTCHDIPQIGAAVISPPATILIA